MKSKPGWHEFILMVCFLRFDVLLYKERCLHTNLNLLILLDIPKVMIEPSGPIHVPKGNGTISKGDGRHNNWIPDVGSTRWPPKTPYIPPVTTNRPTSKPTTRPTPKPTLEPPPPPPPPTGPRTPLPPSPEGPTSRLTTATPVATTSLRQSTVDNRIQTDPQKPRGDVFSESYVSIFLRVFSSFMEVIIDIQPSISLKSTV